MMDTDRRRQYLRYRAALRGEALPLAMVDLDAVDANVEAIAAPVRGSGKTLRIATKSLRCVELVRYLFARGGPAFRGLMAYSPGEALHLVQSGFDDVLIAYPTAQPHDARLIAEANRSGARVSIAVDAPRHLEILDEAGRAASVEIPVIVDIDVSFRPLGGRMHLGVRRSPLHDARAVAEFVQTIGRFSHLSFAGLLGYEAHIAGVGDQSGTNRVFKRAARGSVVALRAEVRGELERRGIAVPLFNGGGTGSVAFSGADRSLTEVTAGSGFLDSHLFDHYEGLALEPAAFFALQVTRAPAPDLVTCQGGGLVASGPAGPDRLPIPFLPGGLSLTSLEGAGEVQTPLHVAPYTDLSLGDPVFFRHAKAGELATFFAEYLLVRGASIETRAPTYRGEGKCFH
jgi:D-serine deaminase-like pyridoxal phosphate-dependent protein